MKPNQCDKGEQPLLLIPMVNAVTLEKAIVKRFQAEKFVFCVEGRGTRHKILQIVFAGNDGSLYVNFPYFDISRGILCTGSIPALLPQSEVSLTSAGKVTSKRVKYAHHPDGEVHFSQTGQVQTCIKKRSLPLAEAEGHLFTLHFQDLSHFEPIDSTRDTRPPKKSRTVLNFDFGSDPPFAFKITGRWHKPASLMKGLSGRASGAKEVGAQVWTQTPDGKIAPAFLVGPPQGNQMERYILQIRCEQTPLLTERPEAIMIFFAGFDPPAQINDLSRPATFLCASYPASNYDQLVKLIGSIDLEETQQGCNS